MENFSVAKAENLRVEEIGVPFEVREHEGGEHVEKISEWNHRRMIHL